MSLNSDQPDPARPDRASAEMTSTASLLEELRAMLVEDKVLAALLPEDDYRQVVTVVLDKLEQRTR